jgi:phospholipase C
MTQGPTVNPEWAPPTPRREAGSLPFPDQPAGAVNPAMPFDHLVVVMMENHSMDNLLGSMAQLRPEVDGLSFDAAGLALNVNPASTGAEVRSFALTDTGQATQVSQSWRATHEQIDGGAMDGFVRSVDSVEPMGFYPPEVLPFAHSLAENFTLANRWFCSVPGPTYPNRRFLMAASAWGGTVTDLGSLLDPPPPAGTIFDRLSHHGISWGDYFTDVPMTALIPSIVASHPEHHHRLNRFIADCEAGTLPSVSFVDPGIGVLASVGRALEVLPGTRRRLAHSGFAPPQGRSLDRGLRTLLSGAEHLEPASLRRAVQRLAFKLAETAQTQEDPADMYAGERWAHELVTAVLHARQWPRILLIYTYDEHGGYYDHVPPPPAIAPDDIPPRLRSGDPPGGYDLYGPRVPAIVLSPYARPGGVTDVVHDHTSVLATIEHKWNLPALSRRDANAATVMDFLDLEQPARLDPPVIAGPASTGPSGPARR